MKSTLILTRLTFALMLLVAMNISEAFAYTAIPRTIDMAIAASDAIVSATVDAASPILVDGERCGTQYEIGIDRIFKADRLSLANSRQRLKVGRSEELRVGREYLLFLQRVPRPEDELIALPNGNRGLPILQQPEIWHLPSVRTS